MFSKLFKLVQSWAAVSAILISILVPIAAAPSANAATASVIIDPASSSSYPGSGTTVTDLVSGATGTMSNVTYSGATNCGVFNFGGNSTITFGQKDFGNSFSFSTWFKAASLGNTIQTFMSNAGANLATNGFKLEFNSWTTSDGKLIFENGNGTSGNVWISDSGNQVTQNTWQHFVFTFDNTAHTAAIYKDKVLVASSGTVVSNIGINNSNWWLGSIGGNSYYLNGSMGATKIYPTVLNQAEINADYDSTSARYASTPTCPAPAAPTISSATISGTANAGQTLTANATLGGGTPTSTTYQWKSATSSAGTYSDISGATSSTYAIANTEIGKYIKVTISVSNVSGSASATSSATSLVNDGLIAQYDAGNTSSYSGTGTTLNDLSGAGLTGTISSSSMYVSTYGKSFSFLNTSSQYINLGNLPANNFTNGFSATFWANFGSNANSWERILDFGNGQANNNILISRSGTSSDLVLETYTGSTSNGQCKAAGQIQSGWSHYALTVDATGCKIYVNGSEVATNGTSTLVPVTIARSNNYLGKSNWAADSYLEGNIGRISIYNRALTSSEVVVRKTAETPNTTISLSTSSIAVNSGSAITNLTTTASGGTPTSYSISGSLPAGLSFNTTNGTLSGTPTSGLSSTTYTITANGVLGVTPTASFTLVVTAPPTIGSANISGYAYSGQELTATAGSLGGGAVSSTTYQWKSSTDNSTFTNISGATNSTYLLTSSEVNKYIKVLITVSNSAGSNSATSSATSLVTTPTTVNFTATGSAQTWTVPTGITSVIFSITGGSGGSANGGKGAKVTGTLAVTPGEILQINVGSQGATYAGGSTSNWTTAAFGGGGRGNYYGSGGGGASDIRTGSFALTDRVAVAGGGGGSGSSSSYAGGNGGTTSGAQGLPLVGTSMFGVGGGGASQIAGGTGGAGASSCGNRAGSSGTLGVGGDGANASAGAAGGGGGYYGGGGGGSGCNAIGGGGGSSWVSTSVVTSPTYAVASSVSAGAVSLIYASPLAITTPTSGLTGIKDSAFSLSIGSSGGAGSNVFSVTTGSLPSGLLLNTSTGLISGTPTVLGDSTIAITVTDSANSTETTSNFVITISNQLTITTPSAGLTGTYNSAYSLAVSSAGGAGSNVFTVSTGTLPTGVTINSSTGTISGTPSTAGNYAIRVTVTDSASSTAITSSFTIAIAKINQTITFNSLTDKVLGSGTFTLSATSSSSLTVAFTSATTSICTVSGTTVTLVSNGTCTINADQSGNSNYNAATRVQRSFAISVNVNPTITSITKNAGSTAGGTSVTISGTNLNSTSSVTFGSSAATISSKNSTTVVVVTPAGSAGAVDVVLTAGGNTVTSSNGYTYVTAPTTRSWSTSVSVTSASPGQSFSVTYTAVCTTPQNYGPSMYDLIYASAGTWTFNSYMGSGTSTDGGYTWTITKNYTLPNTNNVIYKIDAYERGACWDSYNFTYATRNYINVGVGGPTISSLNVTSGPTAGGTAVTLSGTNLSGVSSITVGGSAATSIRSNTSTSVTFNTPSGTAGAKNVVVNTTAGSATSSNAFTYVAPSTITYDVNTADSGSPSRTSDSYSPNTGGYSLPTVGTMVKAGHTFGGWATANNSSTPVSNPYNPQSTQTLYAIWTVINYATTYNANGSTSGSAPSSTSNAFGATITVANNTGSLARTGYTLAGWNTLANGTGTSYILNSGQYTQGASNLTLYAEWVPNTYVVSYDVNGSNDSAPSSHSGVLANGTVSLRAGVTKAGYAFVGWTYNSVTYAAGASFTIGSADASVVAKWIAVYTLSYNLNGTGASGTVPSDFQYTVGDNVIVDNGIPTRSGYTFGGWKDQSNEVHAAGSNYNISSTNYLLYAVWTPIAYTVTYALNGGSGTAPTESSKNVNNTFTVASAPSKIGSTFTGWSDGTNVYGSGSTYLVGTSNITLTAQWSANSYAITYDLAQGTSSVPSGVSKAYLASWTLPAAPTRVGYNFSDWYDGSSGYAAEASYTLNSASNLTITARWNAVVYYSVTYNLDGGLGSAPTQDPLQNGQSFNLAADPSKTGHSFAGWSYASATYSSGATITMPASNITITALWTVTTAGTYAITYITNGSQTAAPTVPSLAQGATFTVDDGSTLIKNGYIFSSWSYGGNTYTGGETITMPGAAVTLSAVWVPSVRATSISHSVDSTSITRGRSITVTYSLGCYNSSNTIPTITEKVTSTGESFISDITSSLTVIDAGYNWTVTRVYTLSFAGAYTVLASANGGCFSSSTDSTSTSVTVTEAQSNGGGNSNSSNNNTSTTGSGTGSIPPVTIVGAKIALVANKYYSLPKLDPKTSLTVEAKTGASASTTTTTTSNGTSTTTTTMLSVNSASKGLSEVKIVENQLAVVPTVGFSGKTSVTVTITDGSSTSQIQLPVTVLPEPVKDPTLTPKSGTSTIITWDASPNATNYQVFVDGKSVCKTSSDSCTVSRILGPNANVDVIANGGDATKSEVVDAEYQAANPVTVARISGTFGKATLSKNDLTNLNKVISTINKQGFENVQITGITTTKLTASAAKARLDAMVAYIQENVSNPDLTIKVVAPTSRTFTNQIAVK